MELNNIVVKNEIDEVIGVYSKMPKQSLANFQSITSGIKYEHPFVSILLSRKGEAFAGGCGSREDALAAIADTTWQGEQYGGIVYAFLSSDGTIADGWYFSAKVTL